MANLTYFTPSPPLPPPPPKDYEHMGRAFCETLMDYTDENSTKVNRCLRRVKKIRRRERKARKKAAKLKKLELEGGGSIEGGEEAVVDNGNQPPSAGVVENTV